MKRMKIVAASEETLSLPDIRIGPAIYQFSTNRDGAQFISRFLSYDLQEYHFAYSTDGGRTWTIARDPVLGSHGRREIAVRSFIPTSDDPETKMLEVAERCFSEDAKRKLNPIIDRT